MTSILGLTVCQRICRLTDVRFYSTTQTDNLIVSKNSQSISTKEWLTDLADTISDKDIEGVVDLANRVLDFVEDNIKSEEEKASNIVSDVLHKIESEDPARIALVGQTSSGKSSTANSLFGKDIAEIRRSTDTTESVLRLEFGSGLVLYDTPGLLGDEKLENITRGFLRIDQENSLPRVDDIPYKEGRNSSVQKVPTNKLDKVAPIDSVIFTIDASRARSRLESEALKNIYLLLSDRYGDKMTVAGTHLDKIEEKDEDTKENLISSAKSATQSNITLVSNTSGKGFEKLTNDIFSSIPSKTDASALQSALVKERKLNRLQYVLTDVGKMASDICSMKGSDEKNIKLSIIAMHCIISSHYSITEEEWRNINGNLESIKKKVSSAGVRTKKVEKDPEGLWETLRTLAGFPITKTVHENEPIGVEGLKIFLPNTVSLVGKYEEGYSSSSIEEKAQELLEDRETELRVSSSLDSRNKILTGNTLHRDITDVLFDIFDVKQKN